MTFTKRGRKVKDGEFQGSAPGLPLPARGCYCPSGAYPVDHWSAVNATFKLGKVVAGAILCSYLIGCGGKPITIDRAAFADHIDVTTDFDAEQSACIADEAFRLFGDATIKQLYEDGVGPLRYTLDGQIYGEALVACTTR